MSGHAAQSPARGAPAHVATVQPGFVLLFSTSLQHGFKRLDPLPSGFALLPEPAASQLAQWREAAQTHVLGDAVSDQLEMLSFTLTTAYQQRMTALQFRLTVVFGATEIGFIAASIATWYDASGLGHRARRAARAHVPDAAGRRRHRSAAGRRG